MPPAAHLPGTALQARPRCRSPGATAVLTVGRLAATPAAFAVTTAASAAAAAAASGGPGGANAAGAIYEFLDEQGEVEPACVHPGCFAATLRFLDKDEGEVVVSLRKVQPGKPWPALVQEWAALVRGVGRTLAGTSIYIVGADSAASWAVACELAGGLQYVPLRTAELVEQAAGVPANHGTLLSHYVTAAPYSYGAAELARMEAAILEGLTSHVRCVVATMGGEGGAAFSTGGWRHLQAGICVHLDCSSAAGNGTQLGEGGVQAGAARGGGDPVSLFSRADVRVAVQGSWHDEGRSRLAAEAVLKAIKGLADGDADLIGKKSLYVRLGCRGDWPKLMPPGWTAAGDGSEVPTAQLAPCRRGPGPMVGETEVAKALDAALVDGSIA
eukprot:SM000042S15400  [mRNA]  locus=s42:725610:728334:+ [translate_table: standard]